MCEKSVELKCNWEVAAGNNLNNILVMLYSSGMSSIENGIPSSDDIIDVSRTILLNNEDTDSRTCELNVKLPTNLCMNSFNIIISGSKILEVFIGNEEEYYGTFHGKYFDDTEGIRVYRYDVEIKRSKTKKLLIKFLNSDKDLWIYGMMLNVFRNNDDENDGSYFPHNTKIDFNNVQSILSNSNYKLSDNAEKCKQFLENYVSTKNHKNDGPPTMKMLLSLMNSDFKQKHLLENDEKQNNNEISLNNNNSINNRNNVNEMNLDLNADLLNEFKKYVDDKFIILQSHIDERLNEIETKQNEKIDKILNILQNKNEL